MRCKNCRFFAPQRTASGRIKHAAGRCLFEAKLPPIPNAMEIKVSRRAAWPDDGEDCATFEEIV